MPALLDTLHLFIPVMNDDAFNKIFELHVFANELYFVITHENFT